jgi:pyruvate kinase
MASFVQWIRAASAKLDSPAAILGDLQGPKFRTGEQVNETIDLAVGHKIRLAYAPKTDQNAKGTAEKIYCPHENLMQALQPESSILIYDGAMELRVTEKHSPTEVTCVVVRGGALRAHKGLNVPSVAVPFPDLLEKDKRDALWMLGQQLDYVGQSFVQTAADVIRLREFWRANLKEGQRIPLIIAKIEKPQAMEDLDKILEAADGLMVARGDLGVELSLELVPIAQKRIIQKANAARKPVITATQMLQSMTTEQVKERE